MRWPFAAQHTYPSYDHRELSLFAMHADIGFVVGHPNSGMMFDRLFAAYQKQIQEKKEEALINPLRRVSMARSTSLTLS